MLGNTEILNRVKVHSYAKISDNVKVLGYTNHNFINTKEKLQEFISKHKLDRNQS